MFNALNPTNVIRAITLLTFVISCLSLAPEAPNAATSLWTHKAFVVGVVNALIFALTFKPIFHVVHRYSAAKHWWFPLLDGEWEGEIFSNWPRIKAMMEAATGERQSFNALVDDLPNEAKDGRVPVIATISSSLFCIQLILRVSNSQRAGRSIFVYPEWRRPDPPRLNYIYEQIESGSVPITDARRHFGAARLEYDAALEELRGEYWTQRQATKGLNTAGSLILRRKR